MKTLLIASIIAMTTAISMTIALPTQAYDDDNQTRKPPRKPPQEAFDACSNALEGDSVTFTSPRGDTIDATCRPSRNGDGLVAVPENHRPPKRGGRDEASATE